MGEDVVDGTRFDGWTRRRFGIAAGGMAATLPGVAGIAGIPDAEATRKGKNKQHKRRCRKASHACTPGGKHTCCGDLHCREVPVKMLDETEFFCCKSAGKSCSGQLEFECCPGLGCTEGSCQPLPKG